MPGKKGSQHGDRKKKREVVGQVQGRPVQAGGTRFIRMGCSQAQNRWERQAMPTKSAWEGNMVVVGRGVASICVRQGR